MNWDTVEIIKNRSEKIYNLYKAEKRYVKILHKILFVRIFIIINHAII